MLQVMWDPMGKLVPQLLGVIKFAYDLHFRSMTTHWKGVSENYTFHCKNITPSIV
jgi:hypothetical protein